MLLLGGLWLAIGGEPWEFGAALVAVAGIYLISRR
jgi:hypothetical protein